MVWLSSPDLLLLQNDPALDFDWDVFYLPPFTQKESRFADGHPTCAIGGSGTQFEVTSSAYSDTNSPESSERLQRVIAFLQYLTVPENYEKIVTENAFLVPNIVGVETPALLKPFEEVLERRYTTTKWLFTFDLKFADIYERALSIFLTGGMPLDEFLVWHDRNFKEACIHFRKRKGNEYDADLLNERWEALATIREQYSELPPPPN